MKKNLSIYIHVPFCAGKCPYCDFYSLPAATQEAMDAYVERYVKAVRNIASRKTLLFCIFPRNDYDDSTAVNRFISTLNYKIKCKIERTDIVYLDVFGQLLSDGRLNPDMTVDDVHLTGAGYQVLAHAVRTFMAQELL